MRRCSQRGNPPDAFPCRALPRFLNWSRSFAAPRPRPWSPHRKGSVSRKTPCPRRCRAPCRRFPWAAGTARRKTSHGSVPCFPSCPACPRKSPSQSPPRRAPLPRCCQARCAGYRPVRGFHRLTASRIFGTNSELRRNPGIRWPWRWRARRGIQTVPSARSHSNPNAAIQRCSAGSPCCSWGRPR